MTVEKYLKQIDEVIANGEYKDNWKSLSNHPTPNWYSDAKFGIFIHWGVYSVPAFGNEWYPRNMYIKGTSEFEHHINTYGNHKDFGYKDFIPMFKAEKFDANQWISLFKKAGARYIMPVAEHHDGFQMYDSQLSKWNSSQMGPCRDIVGELKAAAEKQNITFCASNHRAEHYWFLNGGREYESDVNDDEFRDFYGQSMHADGLAGDWNLLNGLYKPDITWEGFKEHLDNWLARLCELVDKYQPKIVYFDWWIQNLTFKPYLKKFAAYYYNRAKEWGEQVTINYKYTAFPYTCATYELERGQLEDISPRLWQNDTSIANNSWSYTENNEFKTPNDIISNLIDVVSKNGCLLLNVGPKADGTIAQEEVEVLEEIGKWMEVNGEGIYDTTYWKVFGEGPTETPEGMFTDTQREQYTSQDIRYTYNNGCLYAFVLKVPKDKTITFKELKLRGADWLNETFINPTILGYDNINLNMERDYNGLTIKYDGEIDTQYPICIKLELL